MGGILVPIVIFVAMMLISVLSWVPLSNARDIHSFLNDNSGGLGGKSVTKWAVLVAGSNGYDNYRHQADVCHAYQILKNGGLNDENIIVFMYDDIAYNKQNPNPGVIINKINGPNVYEGVPKDYTRKQVTSENFYNVILANKSGLTGGSGKVLDSGPNDHIFIYYSDHGGAGILGMPKDSDGVYADDFLKVLKTKHKAKSYSQMVIYIEACESGSMFDGLLPDNLNIYATTASNPNEFSLACYYDGVLHTFLGDTYSVSWMEDSEGHDLSEETLDEQYKRVKKRTAENSHVMLYGTKKLGKETLSNFLGSNGKKKNSALTEKSTGNDLSLSAMSPLAPQRDAKLYHLRQKFLNVQKGSIDDSEWHLAKKQLDEELSHRENVDQIMRMMINALFGSQNALTMVLETQRPAGKPAVDDWDCFKSMLKNYGTHCGKLSTYGRKYTRAMANMCNAGIRAEQLASVASVVCGGRN
ncbi:unnamed protein product [Rhodiola kirilowii]